MDAAAGTAEGRIAMTNYERIKLMNINEMAHLFYYVILSSFDSRYFTIPKEMTEKGVASLIKWLEDEDGNADNWRERSARIFENPLRGDSK